MAETLARRQEITAPSRVCEHHDSPAQITHGSDSVAGSQPDDARRVFRLCGAVPAVDVVSSWRIGLMPDALSPILCMLCSCSCSFACVLPGTDSEGHKVRALWPSPLTTPHATT